MSTARLSHEEREHFLQLTEDDYKIFKMLTSLNIPLEEVLYEMFNEQIKINHAAWNEIDENPGKKIPHEYADIRKIIEKLHIGDCESMTKRKDHSPILQLSPNDFSALLLCVRKGFSSMHVIELLLSDQKKVNEQEILGAEPNEIKQPTHQFISIRNMDPITFFARLLAYNPIEINESKSENAITPPGV